MKFILIFALALLNSAYANDHIDNEALAREMGYQAQNLTTEARARLEAQRLLGQVREAVILGFEKSLQEGATPTDARAEVEALIAQEAQQLDPLMAPEIIATAEAALDGRVGSNEVSPVLHARLLEASEERQALLALTPQPATRRKRIDPVSGVGSTGLSRSARGIRRYQTRQELVNALVSGDESERWAATANMSLRSTKLTGREETFTAQVSVEFLGSKITAGPSIRFTRKVSTSVDIRGEGLYPLFDSRGIFDLVWKDANGQALVTNGRTQRRFVFFTCDAELYLESERAVSGGFLVAGSGVEGRVMHTYQNTFSLTSRRVLVPDSVDGRQVNLETLSRLCHNDFLSARSQNGRTVRENMYTTARNLTSGLTYRDRALECVQDQHCRNWFAGVVSIHKYRTSARCVRATGSNAMFSCQLRGEVGANCTVVRDGRRVSSGYFEYTCRTGLRCVVTKEGRSSFLHRVPWVGECRR